MSRKLAGLSFGGVLPSHLIDTTTLGAVYTLFMQIVRLVLILYMHTIIQIDLCISHISLEISTKYITGICKLVSCIWLEILC